MNIYDLMLRKKKKNNHFFNLFSRKTVNLRNYK